MSAARIDMHALRARAGFDAEVVSDAVVLAAMRRRAAVRGCADVDAYSHRFAADGAEQDALLEELLVRESWFFRDGAPFALLAEMAERHWRHRPAPLRVLSAPCAGGEEPYSITMALLDAGMPSDAFTVDAIDLSRTGLERARAASYTGRALQMLTAAQKSRHFHAADNGMLVLGSHARSRLRFLHGNLLALRELLQPCVYDAIFCRNAMIYLSSGARARLLDDILALLAPDGLLFVGHAEAALAGDRFDPLPDAATFAFRPRGAQADAAVSMPAAGRPLRGEQADRSQRRLPPRPRMASPAHDGGAPASLATARALADSGRHAEACGVIERVIALQPDAGEAHFLLGIVRAEQGALEPARRSLERALYLQPGHVETLLHLALVLEASGERAAAERLRSRATRAVTPA